MRSDELFALIAPNLSSIEEVVQTRGNAIFSMSPSEPIRVSLLPIGVPAKD